VLGIFKIIFSFHNIIKPGVISTVSQFLFVFVERLIVGVYDLTHFAQLRLEIQNLTQENSYSSSAINRITGASRGKSKFESSFGT